MIDDPPKPGVVFALIVLLFLAFVSWVYQEGYVALYGIFSLTGLLYYVYLQFHKVSTKMEKEK